MSTEAFDAELAIINARGDIDKEIAAPSERAASSDAPPRRRGSRRRALQAGIVLGAAALAGAGGVVVGTRIKSPADAAAERAAPVASLITVPVEMRQLVSTLIVSGETRYVAPTPVRLAGSVGTSGGETQVVTRLPALESEISEGTVMLEVSGRPVFAMLGELPMYRQLTPGAIGPDVEQLEQGLERLGFAPGTVDQNFDAGTEAALDAFYQSHGYASEGASATQRQSLAAARKAVSDAEENVRKANVDLTSGTTTVSASERLAAEQAVDRAQEAAPAARQLAARNNDQAALSTATAAALRDNAVSARDAAQAVVTAASQPGAINPETGETFEPTEVVQLQQAVVAADHQVIEAEQALAVAAANQQQVADEGATNVAQADDAVALARTQLADLDKPRDTTVLQEAVAAAEQVVVDANAALAQLEAEIGTVVPAGEMVFLPSLPTTITTLSAQLGAPPPTDQIAQVSSTDTEIIGRVSADDAELITVGSAVTIELRDFGIETTGVIADVRTPTASPDQQGGDGSQVGQQKSDDSGRLEVLVTADDTSQLREFIGSQVRINVTVSATDDEVLAVPVAAVSVAPDGTSRVEVERERASGSREGRTELVEVTVGLAAQGYAEVRPVAGASLEVGDRVVVGSDTGERENRRQRASERGGTDTRDGTTDVSAEASG
jgi:peptidoglycan hydrolase-like protein with peptidoglycan-binding domain